MIKEPEDLVLENAVIESANEHLDGISQSYQGLRRVFDALYFFIIAEERSNYERV